MKPLTKVAVFGWVVATKKCVGSPEYYQPTGEAKATKLVEILNPLVVV